MCAEYPVAGSGEPLSTPRCFARRHMPPQIESFHGYALATSHKSGVFYSDVRRDAEDYGINKDTVANWTKWLAKEGWFDRLDGSLKRNPITGMYASVRYRVLSHDEWAAKHPGTCRYMSQSDKAGQVAADSPVRKTQTGHLSEKGETTCPKNPEPPVRKLRTKTVKKEREERESSQSEETGQDSNPSHTPFQTIDRSKTLADVVVLHALKDGAAAFTGKAKTEIERIIHDVQPTEEDVVWAVEFLMSTMKDDYAKQTAGNSIAASLKALLMARKAKAAREQQQKEAAEQRRQENEEMARRAAAEAEQQPKDDTENLVPF